MMKCDIALINAQFSDIIHDKQRCLPLGILYLGSILEQNGYSVKLLDYNLKQKKFGEIENDLRDADADLYGISSLSTGYSFVKKLVPLIRKVSPDSKVILGGPVTFAIPEVILDKTGVDVVVEGEAETFIVPLVQKLLDRNVSLNGDRILKEDTKKVVKDLDTLPFPAWHLADVESYVTRSQHSCHSEKTRTIQVITSRGCPFSCKFCTTPTTPIGKTVRLRSGKNVAEEIQTVMERFNVNDIWFIDEEFALSEKRALDICAAIKNLPQKITFACSMRVDIITDRILKEMKSAGCRRIIFGVESGSPKILDAMKKGFTVETAERAIIKTRENGIEAFVNFMFGYPGETEKTIQETVGFMKKHRLYSGFGFTTPLPGTTLFDAALENGSINDIDTFLEDMNKWQFKTKLLVNLTDMPDNKLLFLREQAQKELFQGKIALKE